MKTEYRAARCVLAVLMVLLARGPALAQVEDEQTREHQRQEQRYLERLRESRDPAATEDASPVDRDVFLARAEELVRDKHFNAVVTEHYRVQTDDLRLLVDETGELLESFHAFFERFWADRRSLAEPAAEPSRVFLFRSFYKYNQLLSGDFSRIEVRPKGHYVRALDVIVAHSAADLPQQLPDALVHEAAHQLVERRLYPDTTPSLWVSEGLASYFGYTYRDRDGTFMPGIVGGKSIRLIRDSARGQSREGVERLRRFRRELKHPGGTGLLDALVNLRDPVVFYGAGSERNYAASWMLVHFLLHGEDGRYADAFVRFLDLDGRGAGPDVLYRELGAPRDDLEAEFVRHVRRVKTR